MKQKYLIFEGWEGGKRYLVDSYEKARKKVLKIILNINWTFEEYKQRSYNKENVVYLYSAIKIGRIYQTIGPPLDLFAMPYLNAVKKEKEA